MYKTSLALGVLLCLLTTPAHAVDIKVTADLVFEIELADGWSLHLQDPPEPLVKEIASHVAHEPAAAKATPEQIEAVARKRLAANEAIIYHAASGAHLDIDFSALDPGQSAPSSRTLKNSARYAAESLEGEDDVAAVVWDVKPFEIKGAKDAFLLVADYRQHEQPMKFLGVIGYVEGYWFFLYYTDPVKEPEPLNEMEEMLRNAVVRRIDR